MALDIAPNNLTTVQNNKGAIVKISMLVFCLLFPVTVFSGQIDDDMAALEAAKASKKMTELQYATKFAEIVKQHRPTDYEAHTVAEYRILLATKLQEKKISRAEYNYLWAEKNNAFLAKRTATEAAASYGEDMAGLKEDMQRYDERRTTQSREEEFARQRAHQQAMAQAAQEEANERARRAATAQILQGVGDAIRNSAPRPGVYCTSTALGSSISTTCN